jgi:hypothetical protein
MIIRLIVINSIKKIQDIVDFKNVVVTLNVTIVLKSSKQDNQNIF